MKKSFLLLFTVFSISSLLAQNAFENGYYIDNKGKRTEGYIRVSDFEKINIPNSQLEFSATPNGEAQKISTINIVETGVGSDIKIKKFTVQLDDSNLKINLNYNKFPEFEAAILFLNVLTEGDASLYSFESGKGTKYFYQLKGNPEVKQLFYKRYYYQSALTRENTEFRIQLFENVKCDGDVFSKFSELRYDKSDLLPIFMAYNTCHNSNSTIFQNEKKKKGNTRFSIIGGLQSNRFSIESNPYPVEDLAAFSFNLGGELEFLTNSRRLGGFGKIELEQANCEIRGEYSMSGPSEERNSLYEYKGLTFNFLVGGRYHFNPESKTSFFADASAGISLPDALATQTITFTPSEGQPITARHSVEAQPAVYFSFGVGCMFFKNVGAEIRFDTPKKIIDDNNFTLMYSKLALNLRYTF